MKKRLYIVWLLAVGCWLSAGQAWGAAITMADLPYLCDFEDDAENANWVLNPKINEINTTNAWVIGKAVSYTGGEKSLYVSDDGGVTNTYAATNNVLLAYRDITLEAGEYDVAYDWIGMGNAKKGYLKVVFANRPTTSIRCGNNEMPDWVGKAMQLTDNLDSLNNSAVWRHVQARISIPNVTYANKTTTRLFFVWFNTEATKDDALTTVAIDNFQLAKAPDNDDYPSNIRVTTTLGVSEISWEAESDMFEVLYRKRGDEEFTTETVNEKKISLTGVDYGAYEFWICSINENGKSAYTVFPTVYLYETDCFDALNMHNAEFEYGTWQHVTGKVVDGHERIDYGPDDIRSRHTTHFDQTEIDPRTVYYEDGQRYALNTVPSGEFGSVRLGNWNKGSEYESMTFRYTVESSSMAVLLIKYAIVLENPPHPADEQPRFTLDVFDEEGNSIDTKCAHVDFHSPTSEEWEDPEVQALWHRNIWAAGNNAVVMWQDWKTIGISVDDYVGQTLTIKLTSYDCDQNGHFGYAYFMLNCVRSDVDGLPWGEGSSTRMFTAPEGFDYAWFNRTDVQLSDTIDNTDPAYSPYITENGRYFYVQESDTNTYLCHVTYPTNPECGYWFDASAKPHNPKAEMELLWDPENCQNGYLWWNRCHVMLTNQLTGEIEHRYDKQLESCFLIMEDGTEVPIGYEDGGTLVPMPDSGGTVRYGIGTAIFVYNTLFADTAWYEFNIPAIEAKEMHQYDTICRGESVIFPLESREKLTEPGVYADSLVSSVTGCDSVVLFHLHVHEPKQAVAYDTICIGGRYAFGGRTLTAPGVYTGLYMSQETGCDSILTLRLFQAPSPKVALREQQLCADQPLLFAVENSLYVDRMHIRIDNVIDSTAWLRREDGEVVVKLTNHDVGYHNVYVQFTEPWCETVWSDTLQFGMSLASNLIELHWNDMLTFLSPDYNGGLTFQSYQWYKEGEEIPGATQSYYYDPAMQPDTHYTVRVTMADGSEAWVCTFTPWDVDPNNANRQGMDNPATVVQARKILRNGRLMIICNGKEYSAQGQLIQ